MTEHGEERSGPYGWCVVANVARETGHGSGAAQVQSGLKHFAPGARLWVLPPRYRDEDDQLEVIGVHRGRGGRHVPLIIFRRHLENFRIRAIHSPAVQRAIQRSSWNSARVWCCPELARPWADRWNGQRAGHPSAGFPPWPVRSTFGRDVRPCPHQNGDSVTAEAS